jgi:hypothetical protein
MTQGGRKYHVVRGFSLAHHHPKTGGEPFGHCEEQSDEAILGIEGGLHSRIKASDGNMDADVG